MGNNISLFRSAIGWYYLANWLASYRVPLIPSLLDYGSRFVFASWVPHTAKIGKNVVLAYGGLGIVIHSDAVIGNNVEIGQSVLVGGNGREYGAPEICDHVYIGSGAKVLGPIKVGRGAVIGANSVVLKDVPENCVVVGIPARVIKENIDINQYLWHLKKP